MITLKPMRGYGAFNPNLDPAVANRVGVNINAYKLKPPPQTTQIVNQANATPDALDQQAADQVITDSGVSSEVDDPAGFQESVVADGDELDVATNLPSEVTPVDTDITPPATTPSWWSRYGWWVAGAAAVATVGTVIAVVYARRKMA